MGRMTKPFDDIFEEGALLQNVKYGMFTEKLVGGILLGFEDGVHILISVNEDTDELVVERVSSSTALRDPVLDVSDRKPWSENVGRPIFSAWELENHYGYHDSLQIEFGETVNDKHYTIQLQAIASSIHVKVVLDLAD